MFHVSKSVGMIIVSGFEFPLRVPDIAFFFNSIFSFNDGLINNAFGWKFTREGSRIFLSTAAFLGVVDFSLGVFCLRRFVVDR